MVYRSAPALRKPDAAVVCFACGATTDVVLSDRQNDTFECPVCKQDQPVLPSADSAGTSHLRFVGVDSRSAYDDLKPFLALIEAPGNGHGSEVRLDVGGLDGRVSLSLNSGRVTGFDVVVHAKGLPEVRFSRETARHVDAKRSGIAEEFQTGDRAFDDAVYVESSVVDESLRIVLSSPAVRAAVIAILRYVGELRLNASGVTMTTSGVVGAGALHTCVVMTRTVAGAPRPLSIEHVPEPRKARIVRRLTYATIPLGFLSTLAGLAWFSPIARKPCVVTAFVGFVLALLVQPLLTAALRGRSTSIRELLIARVTTLLWIPAVVLGGFTTANGLFDRSEAHVVELPVASVSSDSDDAEIMHVSAFDDEGNVNDYTFHDPIPPNSRVRVRRHAGAFGVAWEDDDAVLLPGTAK